MKTLSLMMLITSIGILSGCAHMKLSGGEVQARHHEQLVAIDLVNALMQLNGFHPTSANLQMTSPTSAFGKHLKTVLGQAGYAIQEVAKPRGKRYVAYSASTQEGTIAPGVTTYQIKIDHVMLKRSYLFSGGVVKPDSDLYVIGVDSSNVRLNDHIFRNNPQQETAIAPSPDPVKVAVEPKTFPVSVPSPPKPISTKPAPVLEMQLVKRTHTDDFMAGDLIHVSVVSTTNAQMSCYYRDGHGDVVKMFPNRYTPDNQFLAGEILELPGSGMWHMEATKSGADDEIMCLAVPTVVGGQSNLIVEEDFEPLPVVSLDQIYDRYRSEIGDHVLKEKLIVKVN